MKLRRSEWAQLGDSTQKGMSLVGVGYGQNY